MKNLSVPVTDDSFEKFVAIQKNHKFGNQSDCLTHIIDVVYKQEEKQ